VLVALGAGRHFRRSFRTWEENAVPDVVFEVVSEATSREDVGDKRAVYEQLGIPEYFLFDPESRFLDPPLQGYRLAGGAYAALVPGPGGALPSAELGVSLVPQANLLRLADPRTGQLVPTRRERIDELNAEVERLRALLEGGQPNGG
jgi:Putative restriction endonuclease